MEKKRSKGVTIFVILFIIFAILKIVISSVSISIYGTSLLDIKVLSLGILLLVASFAVLRLREWGRKLLLFVFTFDAVIAAIFSYKAGISMYSAEDPLLGTIIGIVLVVLIGAIIPLGITWWFFTRPKVKEQFK